jgi:hypothetical protein
VSETSATSGLPLWEKELDRLQAAGHRPPDEWFTFWWAHRASALQEIATLTRRIGDLSEYIDRCNERIERAQSPALKGAEPKP